jgi:hypothetical protein
MTPWPVGTDTGAQLRRVIRDFVKTWLADAKYKARLPRQHLKVLEEGERELPGVVVRIVSQADPQAPWNFQHEGRDVIEDWHQVALFVKADRKAGGAESVSAVFGSLRSLFANRDSTPERMALEASGAYMCMETPKGLIQDGDEDAEGTSFKQQLNLRCSTDTFLN